MLNKRKQKEKQKKDRIFIKNENWVRALGYERNLEKDWERLKSNRIKEKNITNKKNHKKITPPVKQRAKLAYVRIGISIFILIFIFIYFLTHCQGKK